MFEARGLVLVLLNIAAAGEDVQLPIDEIVRKHMLKRPDEESSKVPHYARRTGQRNESGTRSLRYDRSAHRHYPR